jgi:FkbM family methyltransferase
MIKSIKKMLKNVLLSDWFVFFVMSRIGIFLARSVPKRYKFIIFSGVIAPRVLPIRILGLRMQIETSYNDDYFYYSIMDGLTKWELPILGKWMEIIKSKPGVALDVGGYFGIYSLIAGLGANKKTICYEPNDLVFERLQRNILLNDANSYVTLRNVAIGSHKFTTKLISPIGRPHSSGVQILDSPSGRILDEWEVIGNTKVISLDEDTKDLGIKSISAIKIDVEGYELEVLKGATRILAENHPSIIMECLNTEQLQKCSKLLQTFGYESPLALDGECITGSSKATVPAKNFVFIHMT